MQFSLKSFPSRDRAMESNTGVYDRCLGKNRIAAKMCGDKMERMPRGNGVLAGGEKSRHFFLQLGMAQTATGFLQSRLFPFFENIRFLDHPMSARFDEPAIGAFCRCSPLIW